MSPINEFDQPIGEAVDWTATSAPPRSAMVGTWCEVVPLDPGRHAESLHAANDQDDGSMWTYMPYGPFESLDAYRSWCDSVAAVDDPMFHAVVVGGEAIGVASYLRIDPANGVIEVGHIALSPQLQKTTAATDAMYLMARRVFEELGYRRYEWKCDALNEPSRRAAVRLGFRYEGTFEQAVVYKGRNRDTAWYAITDREWPSIRAEYERWLAPGNFDEHGVQRSALRHPDRS